MRLHRIALCVVALAAGSCSNESNTLEEFELQGTIVEDLEGAPVEGATVTFTSTTLFMAQTTTDGDGHYEMAVKTDVAFGQVRAERSGFATTERTVYFDTRQRTLDLRMRASQ